MKRPRASKKVGLAQRELSWRLRQYKARQKLIAAYAVRNFEKLSPKEVADFERAIKESRELKVMQLSGKITTIPYGYVDDVIRPAVEQLGGMEHFRQLRPNERHRLISTWLRQRGMPVPALSSVSKFFKCFQ